MCVQKVARPVDSRNYLCLYVLSLYEVAFSFFKIDKEVLIRGQIKKKKNSEKRWIKAISTKKKKIIIINMKRKRKRKKKKILFFLFFFS